MQRDERGIALLEALVALTILAGAGTALVAALAGALRSEHALRQKELEIMAADRMLGAMALLSRTDLDRRIGQRAVGDLVVDVQRPQPALYRIGIGQADVAEMELLVTVVYRPEADSL